MSQIIPIYIPTYINSVEYAPARVQPRLLFYNGMINCESYYIESGSTTTGGTAFEQTAFPYFDNYNVVSGLFPTTDSNSLLFYNEEAVYGEVPTDSLYSTYWSKYVNLLYNPRTKLLNASAIIPLADYFKIELNDVVEFRGNYYHLRAVNDYNLKNGECQIQLLGPILADSLPFAIPAPTTTTTTSTSTTSTTTTTAPPNCAFTFNAYNDNLFSVTVNVTASNYSFNLPARTTTTQGGPFNYLYTASWGDGSSSLVSGSNQAIQPHTYVNPGTYTITIDGLFEAWDTGTSTGNTANGRSIRPIISKVNSWGNVGFKALNFSLCTQLDPNAFPTGAPGLYTLKTINSFLESSHATGSTIFQYQQVELPNGILDYSVNLEQANRFGAGYAIDSIPEYLFKGTPNLHVAQRAFSAANYLKALPNKMFPTNMYFRQQSGGNQLLDIREMFLNSMLFTNGGTRTIPPNLFDEVTGSTDLRMAGIFELTSYPAEAFGLTGSAYPFWTSPSSSLWPSLYTLESYKNQVSASNYASIPGAYL